MDVQILNQLYLRFISCSLGGFWEFELSKKIRENAEFAIGNSWSHVVVSTAFHFFRLYVVSFTISLFKFLVVPLTLFYWWEPRDPTRDGYIKEFIKRKWSSGLFWAVGAAKKKKGSGPIMSNFLGCFFQLFVVKKKLYFF